MELNSQWINKWRPDDISDIIGNKSSISKIDEWLAKFDKHNNNTIILSGAHGIGKTLAIELLLKKYNYMVKVIHPDEIKSFRSDMDFEYDAEKSFFVCLNGCKEIPGAVGTDKIEKRS